ncbi:YcaO-like family protein [Halovivax gelatinilyticus]|uniref:YcaO-like family protein n=1 Tax=Halovivax gelatinilyticus TaxID=2961597 RepID=UPI0020CA8DC6|nr:YcaO-like family protein [Halovivax gelatinilyticus]
MDVHFVGDDPVKEEVEAALTDVDIGLEEAALEDIADARVAIVTDVAGSERFRIASQMARDGNTPWISVEVGGVGGQSISSVDAAITGYGPKTACYHCLRARVASTRSAYTTTANPSADRQTVRLAGAIAGRECVRMLARDEESILGSTVELPYTRRAVHPIPSCRCHPEGRDRTIELTDETERTLESTVDRMEGAIDDRVGLVRSIGEVDSYPAPYYLSTLADTEPYSDASAPVNAAGVDEDWNRAFVKAIGEALERYCAGVYRDVDCIEATFDELDAVLDPTTIVRPDDADELDPEDAHPWVEGLDLIGDEPTYLHADVVHFPQPNGGLVPQITTGLGLGSSMADAVISGLTEVIERDATMLAWYSTFEPLELELEDEPFDRLAGRVESEGLSVTPLLVTQDVDVPVVTVAVHRDEPEPDWPAFAVGSAASLDVIQAARNALAEATQNWMELRSIGLDDAEDAGAWIGEYASFPDPARSFVSPESSIDAATVGPQSVPTGTDAVTALLERLEAANLDVYAARITTRDVESIGFEAVRVVVPDAQPLFTDEPYFGERIETVPESLGFESRPDREPHPYP